MKKNVSVVLLLACLLSSTTFITISYAGPVTLAGDLIDAAMIRTIDMGYGLGRINGFGLDAPFVVQDGDADVHQYSSAFKLDVDGNQFAIHFLDISGWQQGTVLRLTDLDFSSPGDYLSNLSVDTNLVGYGLSIGQDSIDILLGGTHFNNNTYFIGKFDIPQSSPVPEPASITLVAIGIAGAFARRKRKS